jgi:hypothetical protein
MVSVAACGAGGVEADRLARLRGTLAYRDEVSSTPDTDTHAAGERDRNRRTDVDFAWMTTLPPVLRPRPARPW